MKKLNLSVWDIRQLRNLQNQLRNLQNQFVSLCKHSEIQIASFSHTRMIEHLTAHPFALSANGQTKIGVETTIGVKTFLKDFWHFPSDHR